MHVHQRVKPPQALCLGAIAVLSLAPVSASSSAPDYYEHIQPLLNTYCVACHACFDAPCQLDLTHGEGLLRGASKRKVYDARRVQESAPTRLFIDAHSTDEWRKRGFFSVIDPLSDGEPILLRLLNEQGRQASSGDALPDQLQPRVGRNHRCPTPGEIGTFTVKYPHAKMPLSFPPMPPESIALIRNWIAQGGVISEESSPIPPEQQALILQWENWLNRSTPEQALVSRWLFEHWYYAKLYFPASDNLRFYRLVRSSTPSGTEPDEIATRRPNDDPKRPFYYRIQPIKGTLVHKNHITFALSDHLLQNLDSQFFASHWTVRKLPGFSEAERANPFTTFAAIPPRARYQFLLDHAEYFVRTFIRGPVCRGQVATAVIRDHFWVMFQSPNTDPFVKDRAFRDKASRLLGLPGIDQDLLNGAKQWFDAAADRNLYVDLRQKTLARRYPQGPTIDTVWDGDGHNSNALLTVFRHHDSASVQQGWVGQIPQTLWLMDYPLLERSYYNLVVNFDVFGTLAHQAQTRLYFDLIRNGAELNFLRMLPAAHRQQELDDWYEGSGKLKLWMAYQKIDTQTPTSIPYQLQQPKTELVALLQKRLAKINRPATLQSPTAHPAASTVKEMLATLMSGEAAQLPAIQHLANASILKIKHTNGELTIYTLVRNRQHTNVAFILGESLRFVPEKDTLTVVEGVATSYPNFIYHIPFEELGLFVAALQDPALGKTGQFKTSLVDRWGIARSDPDFWQHLEEIHHYLVALDPTEAGVLDIYRYQDYDFKKTSLFPSIGILD